MTFPHTIRWRLLAILVIVPVGVMVASEESADAFCGDWLVQTGEALPSDDEEHALNNSASANPEHHDAQAPLTPGKPCDGPICRRNQAPLSPPDRTPVMPVRITDHAIALASISIVNAECIVRLAETAAVSRDGFYARVERPPRG